MICKEHFKHFLKSTQRSEYQPTFWDTQPVVRFDDIVDERNEAIEEDKDAGAVRNTPLSLPHEFKWDTLDLDDSGILEEIVAFLGQNYCLMGREHPAVFSADTLAWFLKIPDWIPEWQCCIRAIQSDKLVGVICGIPLQIRVYQKILNTVAVQVLCVHRKLRFKKMTLVLARELIRRVQLRGVFTGVYVNLSKYHGYAASCTQWYRPINVQTIGKYSFFLQNFKNSNLSLLQKRYQIPDRLILNLKLLKDSSVKQAHALLNVHLEKYDLVPLLSEAQFRHWFFPRPNVVYSFIQKDASGKIADFVSFYEVDITAALPMPPKSSRLRAACLFYYVATSVTPDVLIQEVLVLAQKMGYDVFTALGVLGAEDFIEKLKFVAEDQRFYSFYNWRCPLIDPDRIGFILPHLPQASLFLPVDTYLEKKCLKCRRSALIQKNMK